MAQRPISRSNASAHQISHDETVRVQRQRNALDIYGPSGATIQPTYLERKQDVIAVNKSDLEDILSFDGIAAFFGSLGMFFLSGSVWLIVDKGIGATPFSMTPVLGFCFASVIFGAACLGAGIYMHSKKRGRITKIFNETTVMQ